MRPWCWLLVCTALALAVGAEAAAPTARSRTGVVCSCRCCLRGQCSSVANTSHVVPACGGCTSAACRALLTANGLLPARVNGTFAPQLALSPQIASAAGPSDAATCLAVVGYEDAQCAPEGRHRCKRLSSVGSVCADRNRLLTKVSCWVWSLLAGGMVGIGVLRRLLGCWRR